MASDPAPPVVADLRARPAEPPMSDDLLAAVLDSYLALACADGYMTRENFPTILAHIEWLQSRSPSVFIRAASCPVPDPPKENK